MNRQRWYARWSLILPIANLLLAFGLGIAGDIQERSMPGSPRHLLEHTTAYYAPVADVISYSWNLPAFFLSKLFIHFLTGRGHPISSIPPEDNTVEYCLSILMVWFVLGWCLDRRLKPANRGPLGASIINLLGALYLLFLLWVGVADLIENGTRRIDVAAILVATFIWGSLLLLFFGLNLSFHTSKHSRTSF